MCDWNNNGEYDMQDAFINYHIHSSISGNKQNQNSSRDTTVSFVSPEGIMRTVKCKCKQEINRKDNMK